MSTRIILLPLLLLASLAFAGDDSNQTQPSSSHTQPLPSQQQGAPPQQNSGDNSPQSSSLRALGRALFGEDAFQEQTVFEQNQNAKSRPLLSAADAAAMRERAIHSRTRSTGMTEDELRRALPYYDEQGSLSKIKIAPTNRKSNLLGRPSVHAAEYILFEKYILCSSPIRALHMGATPTQITGDSTNVACIVNTTFDGLPCADILFFRRLPSSMQLQPAVLANYNSLRLTGHTEPPWRILISPSGDQLVSCSDDGTMRLWNLRWEIPGGQEIDQFPGYARENTQATRGEFAAFSPGGRWLATVYQHHVCFRSPQTGKAVFDWEPNLPESQRIMALRFDVNGNTLFAFLEDAKATATPSLKFLQFDIDERKERSFAGTHGVVDGRDVSNSQYVATWDGSPDIVFWDVAEGKELTTLKVAPNHVYDVALSPDHDVLATAGDDGEVKFWKAKSWDQQQPIQLETKIPYKHDGLDLVEISDDGSRLYTGSDDGWLKLWKAPEFCLPQEISQAPDFVNRFALDGTSRTKTTGGRTEVYYPDGTIKITYPDGHMKIYKRQ